MVDLSRFMPSHPVEAQTPEELLCDFLHALSAAGLEPAQPISNDLVAGKLVRFRIAGSKSKSRSAWARLWLDEFPAGIAGDWRADSRPLVKWEARQCRQLSFAERAMLEQLRRLRAAEHQAEVEAQREATAIEARKLWLTASGVSTDHPYAQRKGLCGDLIDRRWMRQSGNMLLVPMQDLSGRIHNLQRIYPSGDKRFLKGGLIDGLFWGCGLPFEAIKPWNAPVVAIGEGVATMAAVRRATGLPVIAALSARNLPRVADALARARPDLAFVVVGDDDALLAAERPDLGNVGRAKAEDALRRIMAVTPRAQLVLPRREIAA